MFYASPKDRWTAVWWPVATAVFATGCWWLLTPETVHMLMVENGPVEAATAALYIVCALAFLLSPRIEPVTRAALVVLFCGFGAREMDFHKLFTGKSVLKVSYYLGDASLQAKLLALLAVGAVALAVLLLLMRHAFETLHRWRRRDPLATSIVVFIVTMAGTKVLDRMENLLAEDWGVVFSPSTGLLIGSLEETIEMSLPLIALVAWLQFRAARR